MESYSDFHALVRQGYTYVVDQRAQADASTSTYFTAKQRCFGSSAFIVKITFNTKETIKNKFGEKSKAEKRRIQRKMERGWLGMDQIKTDYQRRT